MSEASSRTSGDEQCAQCNEWSPNALYIKSISEKKREIHFSENSRF